MLQHPYYLYEDTYTKKEMHEFVNRVSVAVCMDT